MALTLLRHTRPLVEEGICYGSTDLAPGPDLELEAESMAERLASADRIVSSPLVRCLRLAELLGARLGAPVTIDARLREIDFGSWEGRSWDAIPRAELDAWAAAFMTARPHGGESVAMLLTRTRSALARLPAGTRWLVVTHAGVIRAALFAAGGDTRIWQREIDFGEAIGLSPCGVAGA